MGQDPAGLEQVLDRVDTQLCGEEDETGGSPATWDAKWAGTPCCWSPVVRLAGSVLASPAIIREKKTPMETAVPEFWKVARIPEATPRSRGGTLPMIEEELGRRTSRWLCR